MNNDTAATIACLLLAAVLLLLTLAYWNWMF